MDFRCGDGPGPRDDVDAASDNVGAAGDDDVGAADAGEDDVGADDVDADVVGDCVTRRAEP